ncbi:hypothetical protein [Mesorhizobium sp. M0859]|uniref:hypothetical protein n=1 Tax=Mesorhizobium sp. M0859 TaxID=2957014 RepID=UPI00333B9CF7
MTALVVFDTCTRPQYYADVHQLLALPSGTILRYDYQEKYFSPEAFAFLRGLRESDCPIEIILFYGQFSDYTKGSADPKGRLLDSATSVLIPTRYAKLRNVAVEERVGGDHGSRTVVYFHMELSGFPDPDSPAIRPLLDMLVQKKDLPFEKWVALAPEEADLTAFRQEGVQLWGKVVDRLAAPPSQFHGDVFWRIDHLEKEGWLGRQSIRPQPRDTNRFGEQEYASDYHLDPLSSYRVTISSFVPAAEGKDLPNGAVVTVKVDDVEHLTIPEPRQEFRRNASSQFKIAVKSIADITPRYIKLSLKTEIPEHKSPYTPGSVADISLMTRISGYRVAAALVLAIAGLASGGAGVTFFRSDEIAYGMLMIAVGAILLFLGSIVFTGKIKLPGGGKD